jgi:hypothetical protein
MRRHDHARDDPLAVAQETIRHWRVHGVTAPTAWYALTGRRHRYVKWDDVAAIMLKWWLQHHPDRKPQPMRRAA